MELTNEQYHADTSRISKSGIELINKSPAHYYAKYLDPNRVKEPPTKALVLGTITHLAILEPEHLESNYFILDDSKIVSQIGGDKPRSTAKYKEWKADQLMLNQGKTHVMGDDFYRVAKMRDKVHAHPGARQFLSKGVAEKTIYWTDPLTGVKCKCRPDWDCELPYLLDLKTTEDASLIGFGKKAYNYGYHTQDAFYLDGYNENAGYIAKKGFIFVAVESVAPFNVQVFVAPPSVYNLGKSEYQRGLKTYKECLEKNEWPGYGDEVMPLTLPYYAYHKNGIVNL